MKSTLSSYASYVDNPLSSEAVLDFADHCFEQHSKTAKDLLKLAIALDVAEGRISLRCAKLAAKMGLTEEAFNCAITASRDSDTRGVAYITLARLFVTLGEIDAGLRMLELAYDASPSVEEFAAAAVDVLYNAGRFHEALGWVRKYYDVLPARQRTILMARCLCRDLSTMDEGVKMLEHWLTAHPDDHDAF